MRIGNDLDRYLLGLMNDARADLGLNALSLELNLNHSAFEHSQWMIDNNAFSHDGANDSSGIERMELAGFDLGTSWGWAENIGAQAVNAVAGFTDEIDLVVEGWLASPRHAQNILNPEYDVVGFGIAIGPLPGTGQTGPVGVTITQNFGQSDGLYDLDLAGGDSADTLRGQDGDDYFFAGLGNDLILSNGGNDTVYADIGDDSVNTGAGNDAAFGAQGNDFLRGADGHDTLFGDAGNDFLLGDAGEDELQGGIGEDSLSGGDGDDCLVGNAGFDALQGGNGDDVLIGGAQADNLFASNGNDYLRGDAGFDRLFGGFGEDTLEGGDGPDALFGNGGSDNMFGQNGDDRNYGAGGNDLIQDGAGDDLIEAGAGFDTLNGGIGDDLLYGRFNADRFVFTDAPEGFGHDTIGDFAATNPFERIDLRGVAVITDLDDLLNNHLTQMGQNLLISANDADAGTSSSILLLNVRESDLDSTDFLF